MLLPVFLLFQLLYDGFVWSYGSRVIRVPLYDRQDKLPEDTLAGFSILHQSHNFTCNDRYATNSNIWCYSMSLNHGTIMRDAVEEGYGDFNCPVFLNVHLHHTAHGSLALHFD